MIYSEVIEEWSDTYRDGVKNLLVGKKRSRSSLTNTAEDELAEVESREEAFKKLK
jgi:hypothetical protein